MKATFNSASMIVAFALVISTSQTSFSQTSRFGISLNSLTTNFNYGKSNSSMQSYKQNFRGLQVGVSYQIGVAPMFSIVPELYYAMKGGILTSNNPVTVNKSTLRLNTLDLPILARIHFDQFHINAGPYVAYTLGARLKTEGSATIPETKVSIPLGSNGLKRWDYGLQAGAGYDFRLKKSTLALDVRYGYGLANLSENIERYNRMLNISLTIRK